jgi:hypothetical protein
MPMASANCACVAPFLRRSIRRLLVSIFPPPVWASLSHVPNRFRKTASGVLAAVAAPTKQARSFDLAGRVAARTVQNQFQAPARGISSGTHDGLDPSCKPIGDHPISSCKRHGMHERLAVGSDDFNSICSSHAPRTRENACALHS